MAKVFRTASLPKKIESGNKFTWSKWYIYDGYKKGWHKALSYFFPVNGIIPEKKIKIKITSYRDRILDEDNFRAGAKPIPDFFKRTGYIRDDNTKYCSVEYKQVKCSRVECKTVVEVEILQK